MIAKRSNVEFAGLIASILIVVFGAVVVAVDTGVVEYVAPVVLFLLSLMGHVLGVVYAHWPFVAAAFVAGAALVYVARRAPARAPDSQGPEAAVTPGRRDATPQVSDFHTKGPQVTRQVIDPFSITVLRDRPDIAIAHDLKREVAVEVQSDGSIVFEGSASTSWTAYQNNGGSPLIVAPDVEFRRADEN